MHWSVHLIAASAAVVVSVFQRVAIAVLVVRRRSLSHRIKHPLVRCVLHVVPDEPCGLGPHALAETDVAGPGCGRGGVEGPAAARRGRLGEDACLHRGIKHRPELVARPVVVASVEESPHDAEPERLPNTVT